MELKPDLIRATLLFSESLPLEGTMSEELIMKSDFFDGYTEDEITHAILTLGDKGANLIKGKITYASGKPYRYSVGSPTFEGASYLENIRDDSVWKTVKEKTSGIAGVSIGILAGVAEAAIKNKLGL